MNPRIAVIGGGWAGLAAATHLREAGCRVTVFDAARTPGGRARRVARKDDDGLPLDNGQHILLGAYHDTLALMRRLGCNPEKLFLRTPLRLESADGRFRLAIPARAATLPRLPATLAVCYALLTARGLRLRERLAALTLMRALHAAGWSAPPDWSVAQLLTHHRQPPRLQALLWQPLCLAALNTPTEYASAVLFAAVLRDSLARRTRDTDLLLPRTDLSSLWPDAAITQVDWRPGHRVRNLTIHGHTPTAATARYAVDGEPFDAIVLASPPEVVATLLRTLPPSPESDQVAQSELLQRLTAFQYLPITTLTLTLAAPWRLPAPMLMLEADPARDYLGQWCFDRTALTGGHDPNHAQTHTGELAVVISAAHNLPERHTTATLVEAQLRTQLNTRCHWPRLPAIARYTLITEKRATFVATPGLARPSAHTPWPGLVLAGDWTDTGYPGVLEGAVRSGLYAAQAVLGHGLETVSD